MSVFNFFGGSLKVEGLIRLMEGDSTGPINLGNPGKSTALLKLLQTSQ